jgi:hypothetical protein
MRRRLAAISIAIFTPAILADVARPANKACLLQQGSLSHRLQDGSDEASPLDQRIKESPQLFTQLRARAPDGTAKKAPSHGGKGPPGKKKRPSTKAPTSPPKEAPTSLPKDKGKGADDSLNLGDDESATIPAEMRLKDKLETIDSGPTGPVSKFSSAFQSEVSDAMGTDPERLQIIGMSSAYFDMDSDKSSLSQYRRATSEGTEVHFEVLPGKPSAGRSLSKLAGKMRDKQLEGSLGKELNEAALVIPEGSKAQPDSTIEWRDSKINDRLTDEKSGAGSQFGELGPWLLVILLFVLAALAVVFWMRSRNKK